MAAIPIHRAKAELSRLVERACAGEDVVIARGKQPLVRLVPVNRPLPERKFGALKGKIKIDDAFFEPLPDDELADWE